MFLLPFCSLSWGIYFGKVSNKWSRLYWLKLQLNICIDNSNSESSSNSSTCNLSSSRTVLIQLEIVTSEAFLFNCLHDLFSGLFIFTVEDIKSRSQEKHVKLCSNFSSLLSHKTNSLFQRSLYHFPASKLSLAFPLCVLSSLFCSLRKFTSKTFPLLSSFDESKFCWQSAGIRLRYHLGSKWLALKK